MRAADVLDGKVDGPGLEGACLEPSGLGDHVPNSCSSVLVQWGVVLVRGWPGISSRAFLRQLDELEPTTHHRGATISGWSLIGDHVLEHEEDTEILRRIGVVDQDGATPKQIS